MAKEYAKKFYNGKEWMKCKSSFMKSKNYICERCGGVAKIVHHKKHINESNINDFNITLNWDNLQAVCLNCHNVIHGSNPCVEGVSFDSEGNLIYTPPSLKNNRF